MKSHLNYFNHFSIMQRYIHEVLAHPWPYRIVRLALATFFIYAGIAKLFHPKAFAAIISQYGIAPEAILPVIAIGLPLIETAAGLALVFDRAWGLHLITGLLALFVLVLGYGILRDLNVDCGCFGVKELNKQASLRQAFYRDLVLIGLAAPYLYFSRHVQACARSEEGRQDRGKGMGNNCWKST